MSTVFSAKKFEMTNGIVNVTASNYAVIDEKIAAIGKLTDKIAMKKFTDAYMALRTFQASLAVHVDEMGTTIGKMGTKWAENKVNGAGFVRAAEDLVSASKKIQGVTVTGKALEEPDGLHEEYTAEAGNAIKNAISEIAAVEHKLVQDLVALASENVTEDTKSLLELCAASEKFSNAFIATYNKFQEVLKGVNIVLEDQTDVVKKLSAGQLANSSDSSAKARAAMDPVI